MKSSILGFTVLLSAQIFASSNAVAQSGSNELSKITLKAPSVICYSLSDLQDIYEAIADENDAVATKLVTSGKCLINRKRKTYDAYRYDPKAEDVAIILPSGKWARAPQWSVEK